MLLNLPSDLIIEIFSYNIEENKNIRLLNKLLYNDISIEYCIYSLNVKKILSDYKKIKEIDFEILKNHFIKLYKLNKNKLIFCNGLICYQCENLIKINALNLLYLYCYNCYNLIEINALNLLYLNCSKCYNLIKINAPNVIFLNCCYCYNVNKLNVPNLLYLECQYCYNCKKLLKNY